MTSTMKTEEVLHSLRQQVTIPVHSTRGLVGKVSEAADDKERERKESFQKRQEEGKTKTGDTYEPLRRKPGLSPLPSQELGLAVRLSFWDVLHHLGRGLALSQRGASRGLAEHWGSLKYCQALVAGAETYLRLSEEGERIAMYYKALQSEELGQAFGLAVSEQILAHRYPDHSVSIVRADTALRAGWTLTSRDKAKTKTVGYQYRPQFFAEVWKPGKSSRVFPIVCKGNHSDQQKAYEQLASAAAHADGVHIGAWNETPALLFSTEISLTDPLTVHALHTDSPGGWLHIAEGTPAENIGLPLENKNPSIGILKPGKGKEPDSSEPGCQVGPDHYEWFQRALARVGAAGLTAFAGDGESTAALLTTRQGSDFFQGFAHASVGSVQDVHYTLLGEKFEGTDHVFRLNGERVQAFSGVAKDILNALVTRKEPGKPDRHADVAAYRQQVHERRDGRHGTFWDDEWGGVVSISREGTALAMRQIPPFHNE
ncbi:hypothetical protein OG897_17365 [Streptomyces sp. NBC_00237]|uniref:hypothetical protein n=1 Tax=Streptomyces sp. NBC_00237 TaxID=2975687 RepID=UPI002256B360|nr:hypothetical protein [Streptomyces sp. NBC_00237]MCX5203207.1 hypothetical protein [Streptomyces sp. NBC_00237]